ncbi:hypothetical protein F4801DRAFT_526336 [Xylaria longipes]|nr:hypothetical protein F4801DRAFT_526336 [Xylaria longipes]RYC62223.1 hypothetical protein CHU98_g3983 [Xylaria longipes]
MDQLANIGDNTTLFDNPGADIESTISGFTDLPHEIFILIISYLSPTDCILCRRVSRSWNAAFRSHDASWNLMRWHFPRAREMRIAAAAPDWAHIFPKVARRYFYLRSARPRLIKKIDIAPQQREDFLFHEVEPWSRWLRWNDNVGIFHHRDLNWCLEDGLLIYLGSAGQYIAYDLETGIPLPVPFDGIDKTVRRLRLAQGILVIEWCEREPCCQSDDGEDIHRHFATAFDVRRSTEPRISDTPGSWEIQLRSEWKLHQFGFPVNRRARFFSAHTSTHYAFYLWQHHGSLGDEELLVEQLTIWEIGCTPSRRPEEGPAAAKTQDTAQPQPRVIKMFTGRALDFLGIRQHNSPVLREILLDEANVYVHEEEHPWLAGQQAPQPPPPRRHHHVRSTGIPFSGVGPRWFDECCANGDIHMSFCPRAGSVARLSNGNHTSAPDHLNGKWAGWAPCWRHEEFPYLTVSDVVDERAGVRIAARQCFVIETLSSFVLPKISLSAEPDDAHEIQFADDMWKQLLGKGKIMGDERWVVGEDSNGNITVVYF